VGGLLLVVLCLAVYLPGFAALPCVDRDEARFAQASRQMAESGDHVVPRVQGRVRLNKPPLIYWLQSTAARALTDGETWRDAIWMYRVPSLLGAIVAVLAAWRMGVSMGRHEGGPGRGAVVGWLAGAILAVCPVMFWEAHQARADMVLVAFTSVALWMMWEVWNKSEGARERERERGEDDSGDAGQSYTEAPSWRPRIRVPSWVFVLVFWLAVGAGVMTKGPITPMVAGLGAVGLSVMSRRWRWAWELRPVLGLLLVGVMVTPWVWLVGRQVGWETYTSTVKDEILGRSLEPKEGHGGPPGFHTVLMPLLLFPGSLLVFTGLWTSAKQAWATRRAPGPSGRVSLFLICVLVPSWLVFEIVGTKLPHYTMPLYPLLAIAAARVGAGAMGDGFDALLKKPRVFWGLGVWLVLVPFSVLAAGVALGAGTGGIAEGLSALGAALVVAGLFCTGAVWAFRRRDLAALAAVGLVAFGVAAGAFTAAMARADWLWISRAIAAKLETLDPRHERPIATVLYRDEHGAALGYEEDSLVFLTHGRIERVADSDLDAWRAAHPRALLVVPALEKFGYQSYLPLAGIEGFNYSKGRITDLAIVERRR
jgi:4-amino-4-deoxy-L-arabinose transferase-like glycosyltransferase